MRLGLLRRLIEVLTGDANDSGKAFRTPLATLHVFNGWADKFLTTPAAGLDDRYLKFKVVLRLHNIESEDGVSNFGDELDLRIGYKLNAISCVVICILLAR